VFISPERFRMILRREKLSDAMDRWKTSWITKHELDAEILRAVHNNTEVDLLLVPLVYLWHKDEADYREEATASSTQVGMTLSLVDPASGRIMWEATDENFIESVRTEGGRIQSSVGGVDRRISGVTVMGKDMYAAPPFENTAVLVVEVLVGAIPGRSAFEE
jgi:hypothetical protein